MSALDKLEKDESFQAMHQGVHEILGAIDDPERVNELLEEDDYDTALEEIDTDADELETRLQILHALANEIGEREPELMEELRDELDQPSQPSE